jgi:hypothetical protein
MNGAGFSSPWEIEGMDLLSNIAHKNKEKMGYKRGWEHTITVISCLARYASTDMLLPLVACGTGLVEGIVAAGFAPAE